MMNVEFIGLAFELHVYGLTISSVVLYIGKFVQLKCLCCIYISVYIKCIVTNKYASHVLEYNYTNSQKICM